MDVHANTSRSRSSLVGMRVLLLVLAIDEAVGQCDWFCGRWACPWDNCRGCEDTHCRQTSRSHHATSPHGLQLGGTPSGFQRAAFKDKNTRVAPAIDVSGPKYPTFSAAQITEASQHVADITMTASEHDFTAFHLGTNLPIQSPNTSKLDLAPVLAAAGIRVWRWPGGAQSNI